MTTTTALRPISISNAASAGFTGELYTFHGFTVLDSNGRRVGRVDWIWTNEATGRGDVIGLQLQWLRGKARAVPAGGAVVDLSRGIVRLPVSREEISGVPRFRIDRDLTRADRSAIASHYSPSPLAAGSAALLDSKAA